MLALSVQQPWLWPIVVDGKVENRSWSTNHRGLTLLHASGKADRHGFRDQRIRRLARRAAEAFYVAEGPPTVAEREARLLTPEGHVLGAICAVANLVDVHPWRQSCEATCRPWGERSFPDPVFHWVFRDAHWIDPVSCKGALKLWTPKPEVLEQLGGLMRPVTTVQHLGGLL